MSFASRATGYAQDVVENRIPACRYVRLACQRHLDDLEDESSPYYFDAGTVEKVCGFLELLPHVKGKWARDSDTLGLEDWQCFLVGVPMGWLRKSDGKRRYRRAYCEIPRKNAKSTISAGLGLFALGADDEPGAEVYCGAGSEVQAWEVFRPAKQMAERTPLLREGFGLTVNAKTLVVEKTTSRFAPVIGKPGDGSSPSFAIVDEYHEHQTEDQYDTFLTGMGAREQPMLWTITTAGADTSGPCYALRAELIEVLEGKVENPELFGIIYTVDEADDWTSPDSLAKANPNLGVSVSRDFLEAQQRDAINNPRKQSAFKTKHLNQWVGAASPFFNGEKWERLADRTLSADQFKGEPCYIALDLAAKLDMTARIALFRVEKDGADHFYCFPRFYCPEDVALDPSKRAYAGWVHEGHLIATPGNVTDFGLVEDEAAAFIEDHNVMHAAFDSWNSIQMSLSLSDRTGVECVEVPMTAKALSDPMKWVQALIEDGRLHHDGNPIMSWMIGNVTAQVDRNDNVFPRKERPANKIDGAVALIMAMERGFQLNPETSYLVDAEEIFVL